MDVGSTFLKSQPKSKTKAEAKASAHAIIAYENEV